MMVAWGGFAQVPAELFNETGEVLAALAIVLSAVAGWIHWKMRTSAPRTAAGNKQEPVRPAPPDMAVATMAQTMAMVEVQRDLEQMRAEIRETLQRIQMWVEDIHKVTHEHDPDQVVPRIWTVHPDQRHAINYLKGEVERLGGDLSDGLQAIHDRLDSMAS